MSFHLNAPEKNSPFRDFPKYPLSSPKAPEKNDIKTREVLKSKKTDYITASILFKLPLGLISTLVEVFSHKPCETAQYRVAKALLVSASFQ